jgi:hypothetical protein
MMISGVNTNRDCTAELKCKTDLAVAGAEQLELEAHCAMHSDVTHALPSIRYSTLGTEQQHTNSQTPGRALTKQEVLDTTDTQSVVPRQQTSTPLPPSPPAPRKNKSHSCLQTPQQHPTPGPAVSKSPQVCLLASRASHAGVLCLLFLWACLKTCHEYKDTMTSAATTHAAGSKLPLQSVPQSLHITTAHALWAGKCNVRQHHMQTPLTQHQLL